jgi:acyl-CoA thioesterase I
MPSKQSRPYWLALAAATIGVTASLSTASTKPYETVTAEACTAPARLARLDHALERTARRLAAGEPVSIVALGSSSTAGAGASSEDHAYPNRLAAELRNLFPGGAIVVLNRGVNGEEAADMVARLDDTVLSEKPDLVLWQVGTNAVLRDQNLKSFGDVVHEGLVRIKAAGADVVLMDPQFAPQVIASAEIRDMVGLIAARARQDDVGLFHRYSIMQNWHDASGIPFDAFISPDKLHMNDWGYGCVAKILGGAIAEKISPAIRTATAATR